MERGTGCHGRGVITGQSGGGGGGRRWNDVELEEGARGSLYVFWGINFGVFFYNRWKRSN